MDHHTNFAHICKSIPVHLAELGFGSSRKTTEARCSVGARAENTCVQGHSIARLGLSISAEKSESGLYIRRKLLSHQEHQHDAYLQCPLQRHNKKRDARDARISTANHLNTFSATSEFQAMSVSSMVCPEDMSKTSLKSEFAITPQGCSLAVPLYWRGLQELEVVNEPWSWSSSTETTYLREKPGRKGLVAVYSDRITAESRATRFLHATGGIDLPSRGGRGGLGCGLRVSKRRLTLRGSGRSYRARSRRRRVLPCPPPPRN